MTRHSIRKLRAGSLSLRFSPRRRYDNALETVAPATYLSPGLQMVKNFHSIGKRKAKLRFLGKSHGQGTEQQEIVEVDCLGTNSPVRVVSTDPTYHPTPPHARCLPQTACEPVELGQPPLFYANSSVEIIQPQLPDARPTRMRG